MRRATFNQYIKEIDFKGLFITEMGWNRFHGQADIQPENRRITWLHKTTSIP